jgi:predicted anti-sigma-YlaC factor YlaD
MKVIRCEEVREMLPAYLDEPGGSLAIRRHLAGCEGCRAELARYESLKVQLPELQTHTFEAPADLLPALKAIPASPNPIEAVKTHVWRNRNAYVGGAAVLAASAAAALWRSRRRLVTA